MSIHALRYSGLELDIMRGGFALAVLLTLDMLLVFGPDAGRSRPVGLARLVDLGWVSSKRKILRHAAQIALVAYLLDWGTVWALLYLAAFLVVVVTALSSDGAPNHAHHLVVVVAVVQLAAVTFWNAAAHWRWDVHEWVADSRGSTMVWWSVQAMLAVYLTTGITKILHSRAEWISRSPGLLVAAAARLDTAASMGSAFQLASARRAEQAVRVLFAHAGAARLLFAAGLLVELTAPLGLFGENALLVVGLALLALHQANLRLLSLPCHSYQILVITYLVNVPRFWA